MITKIQQYLITRYPLLWNIRLIPFLLFAIGVNLFFYFLGFVMSSVNFKNMDYYDFLSGNELVYFGSVFLGVLLFILWLVQYSKNNAFKVFYPKNGTALYLEWLLSIVIIFSLVLFPFSFYFGSMTKVRSYASRADAVKAAETLNMIRILIPTDATEYYEEANNQEMLNSSMKRNPNYADRDELIPHTIEAASEYSYPETEAQFSLLYYSGYDRIYISDSYGLNLKSTADVKNWLIDEDKGKISRLIDDFLALQSKHGLSTNLTKKEWMDLIYNPSDYPVGSFNKIVNFNYKDARYSSDYTNEYYVSHRELASAYDKVINAYYNKGYPWIFLLVVSCLSLGLSLLVFSFRITSGKSWLGGFISIGLILFIDLIIALMSPGGGSFEWGLSTYIFILLGLFIAELIYLTNKIKFRKPKGRSNIIINHFVWFLPAVPVLIFTLVYIYYQWLCYNSYLSDSYSYDNLACITRRSLEDNIVNYIWANVCLTFVSMFLFIKFILLKWKSLPEE